MSIGAIPAGDYHNITSSANVLPVDGTLLGIFVASASNTPTLQVYDSATTGTGTPVTGQFTPSGATYYPLNMVVKNGAYVVIGGTVNCTVVTAP